VVSALHFPAYWARAAHADKRQGRAVELSAWRWSDASLAEAQQRAAEAARALVERFIATGELPDAYGYSDRALREPVLRELQAQDGGVSAAVTRNLQGAEVLNTTGAMFVDIDNEPQAPRSLLDGLKQLFGKRGIPAEQPQLERVRAYAVGHPDWGLRVYRTAGGLRVLITHALIQLDSAECEQVFEALGADLLYRRLCDAQQSYRARLTPKHWRCGLRRPPSSWPFSDAAAEAAFEKWQARYRAACRDRRTCELVETLGNRRVHPEIAPIVELHDAATRVSESLPLA
jgi:hypothetical protein